MRYSIKIEAEYLSASFLRTLKEHKFVIFQCDKITNEIVLLQETNVIYLGKTILCLYNGDTLPPWEIIQKIEENAYNYTIEKKR